MHNLFYGCVIFLLITFFVLKESNRKNDIFTDPTKIENNLKNIPVCLSNEIDLYKHIISINQTNTCSANKDEELIQLQLTLFSFSKFTYEEYTKYQFPFCQTKDDFYRWHRRIESFMDVTKKKYQYDIYFERDFNWIIFVLESMLKLPDTKIVYGIDIKYLLLCDFIQVAY
jgi:hypothetical protein